ncbi:MAG TPA: hypothetical protein VJG90_00025 [Candidatus Nanoarchaeia archaeon]|nr:hypothetical protein [Candidatus Nanoarchaeia archaeon]
MVDYKCIKYCRHCKERFVVPKAEARQYLCSPCQRSAKITVEART